ncbi:MULTISPECIES: glycosyltransferase family 2 protein [Aeromonas]
MLSIIVPVYNSSKTIVQCLNSIINQTSFGLVSEIIIINDGSTDNSDLLIREFMGENSSVNFKYIYKENGGVSSARNLGINISCGIWIAFIDSDDIWLPNKLSEQFKVIKSSPFNIDFIGCARNDEMLTLYGKKITSLHKATLHQLLIKMFPQTSTAIVKKTLLNKVGYYDESMSHAEDGDLWLRLCDAGDFYYMPQSLVITGGGKNNYGESGLSSNLSAMHKGTIYTINKLHKSKRLSNVAAFMFKVFYYVKHIRRTIIVISRRF